VISDQIARYSDHIFNTVASGVAPGFVDGWVGAFAYGLQIYFDFSGYSDMAVGLAYIFGFRLPINFFSPYKSASPRDFWRRWHISLSNFLREYLYIPLGGNRFGLQRTLFALMATMVLGGLWHGAALTFIVWGTLHGALLVANHLYQSSGLAMRFTRAAEGVIPRPVRRCLAIAMTYIAVTAIWVYFRAPDVATANRMIAAMFGVSSDASFTPLHADVVITLLVGQAIVFLLPNTAQLFRRFGVYQHADRYMDPAVRLKPDWLWTYRLTPRWAVTSAITFLVAWFALSNLSPFIYFQF
jgi:D-alanyl-lipoteichoic acid acyltransferase DltB (MBOAT superfamily)